MIPKRRQYLIDNGPLPRRTAYRRMKALEARCARLAQQGANFSDTSEDEQQPVSLGVQAVSCANAESPHSSPGLFRPSESLEEASDPSALDKSDYVSSDACSSASEPIDKDTYVRADEDSSSHDEDNRQVLQADLPDHGDNSQMDFPIENYEGDQDELHNQETLTEDEAGDRNNTNDELNFVGKTDDPSLNNQLCLCSSTTEGDALIMCLSLAIRHNLTWSAMVDIMKMINALYGHEVVDASKYFLQKYLDIERAPATYHYFCPECETYLGVKKIISNSDELKCECSEIPDINSLSYFVSVDMISQFKILLQEEDVANEILNYRFQRKKQNINSYEDIFDGECYKDLCRNGGILSNPDNFSYTFNTDGIQIGKSSSNAAWPIFLSVNELSPLNRKRHMQFAGLWVGKKQPNMRIFLQPFVHEANKLSREGFDWTDSQGVQHHSKVIALCCVVDSAARYKLLNMTCYSGYFGCTFCYQRAENTSKGRRFTITDTPAPLRTNEAIRKDMITAARQQNDPDKKKRIVKGCKGPSPLATMDSDLDKAFVVDSMHNSYLRNIKSHTGLLLTSFSLPYYIGSPRNLQLIASRLCSICPPSCITRTPRTIIEWKIWKASEWRSWLIFYVLVCLEDVLQPQYITHLSLLSSALYLLLQKSLTLVDIQTAHQYLMKYVFLTEQYFGKTAMLYNVHLLLHLCRGVVNFGPLWTHAAFQFEGENRYFMQMNTSPAYVPEQLARRYTIFATFSKLCEMYVSSERTMEFASEISGKSLKNIVRADGCVLIGKGQACNPDEIRELITHIDNAEYYEYQRMYFGGLRFSTSTYAQGKKKR